VSRASGSYIPIQTTIGLAPEVRDGIEELRASLSIGGRRPSLAAITRELLERGLEVVKREGLRSSPKDGAK